MKKETDNKILNLFGFMVLLFWMAMYSYQPQLSVYTGTLGASITMTGVILGSYGFTQMIVRLPLGIISDILKKRKLFVLIGNVFAVLSALGLFLSRTPAALLLFRCISGIAASVWVVMTVMFSGYFPKDKTPEAMSRLMIFNKCGCLSGMVLGGLLADAFSVKASFILGIAAGSCALVLGLMLKEPDMSSVQAMNLRNLPSLLQNRRLLIFSIMALLIQVMEQGTTLGFVPKYAAELGADASALGLLSGASIFGGMCASMLISGWLLKRYSVKSIAISGCGIFTVTAILLPVLAKSVPLIIIFQFLAGLGNSLCFVLLNGLAIQDFEGSRRGAAMGIFQAIYALGMFLGPLLTGFLADHFSIPASISLTGCTGILLILLGLYAFR